MAQEWKTFSAENREATTGSGNAKKPWVGVHLFGEFTCLKMKSRPPELNEALFVC